MPASRYPHLSTQSTGVIPGIYIGSGATPSNVVYTPLCLEIGVKALRAARYIRIVLVTLLSKEVPSIFY